MTDVREMTRSAEILDYRAINSSVMPSAKYSCEGSGVRFSSGRTARDFTSGRAAGADGRARLPVDFQTTNAPRSAAATATPAIQYFRRRVRAGATAAGSRGTDATPDALRDAPLSSSRSRR